MGNIARIAHKCLELYEGKMTYVEMTKKGEGLPGALPSNIMERLVYLIYAPAHKVLFSHDFLLDLCVGFVLKELAGFLSCFLSRLGEYAPDMWRSQTEGPALHVKDLCT